MSTCGMPLASRSSMKFTVGFIPVGAFRSVSIVKGGRDSSNFSSGRRLSTSTRGLTCNRPRTTTYCSAAYDSNRSGSDARGARSGASKRSLSDSTASTLRANIVVLGGGFGGLYTTLHLAQLPWSRLQKPSVTLVDRSDRFVFLPLLYEVLMGTMSCSEVAPYFNELLAATSVRFLHADAAGVDVDNRKVQLSPKSAAAAKVLNATQSAEGMGMNSKNELAYDRLVLATGSVSKLDMIENAEENAFSFSTLDDALALRERVRFLRQSGRSVVRVTVIGGGYAGVELAASLAEMFGDQGAVNVLTSGDKLLPSATAHNRKVGTGALKQLGVNVEYNARVMRVNAESVDFQKKVVDGAKSNDTAKPPTVSESLSSDLTVVTIGGAPASSIPGLNALPQTKRGQFVVDRTLAVKERPEVFALGDVAASVDTTTNQPSKINAQAALQQSDYVSWNIYASLCKERSLSYRYLDLGEMLSLGAQNATVTALDSLKLSGSPAQAFRRTTYLARMPTDLHRLRIGASVTARPFIDVANRAVSDLLRNFD